MSSKEQSVRKRAEGGQYAHVRTPFTPQRYRDGGRRAADAMEAACRALRPGMDEHEIAGVLDQQIHKAALNPLVTLVAGDERIKFLLRDHCCRAAGLDRQPLFGGKGLDDGPADAPAAAGYHSDLILQLHGFLPLTPSG